MNTKSSLKKNLAFQTIYQIINTCIPLITSPYLARALGATSQGIFSYTQSIVNYFTLIAMLGVVNYGTRTIALCGEDKKKRSETFWNIYVFQAAASVVSLVGYVLYAVLICKENQLIAILLSFYVLGSLFDISWLWSGVEKFDYIVKLSLLTRLLYLAAILIFVKSPSDLWIYALIISGGTFFGAAIMWSGIGKIIDFKSIKSIRPNLIASHIKPNLVLFVPLLAMSVYHIMDKTMLGFFSTYDESGYYYNADKVINIPIGVIGGIQTVMLPRMTNLIKEDTSKSEKVLALCLEVVIAIATAMAFGIAAVAKEFTPVFFGKGFDACILLIMALSPVLIIKGFSNTARFQVLVPMQKERILIEAVIIGAISNLIINLICIPKLGAMGAIIGTVLSELIACIWEYVKIGRFIDLSHILVRCFAYFPIGGIMFLVVRLASRYNLSGLIGLVIEICIGGLVYMAFCLFYWKSTKNPILKMLKK